MKITVTIATEFYETDDGMALCTEYNEAASIHFQLQEEIQNTVRALLAGTGESVEFHSLLVRTAEVVRAEAEHSEVVIKGD